MKVLSILVLTAFCAIAGVASVSAQSALTLGYAVNPNFTVGQPVIAQKPKLSGMTEGVSVALTLVSGKLPPGLVLAADGTISGTPVAEGTFPYVIQAIDGSREASAKITATVFSASSPIALKSDFVPFAMCMSWDGRDGGPSWYVEPDDQIRMIEAAGYTGMGLGSLADLKKFADNADVHSGKFRVYSALWWATASAPLDLKWLDSLLVQAQRMNMAMWVVAAGSHDASGKASAVRFYKEVAAECKKYGVLLVLYPHAGTAMVSAEEALDIYNELKTDYPEVRISIHLCHELAAGNGKRLTEVVAKTASLIALATVNGTNGSSDIRSLDLGGFDVRPFLQALADNGYSGPMELHTYSFPDPQTDDSLARSLARYRQLVDSSK